MKYPLVLWDIDGTLYDPLVDCSEGEENLPNQKSLSGITRANLKLWVPYKGLTELLRKIPRCNQGIISNGYNLPQRNKIALLGLEECFNTSFMFISGGEAERLLNPAYGKAKRHVWAVDNMMLVTQKPEAYMFKRALQISGVKAEEAIMIGDHWTDIAGAQKIGMRSVYIKGNEKPDEINPIKEGKIIPYAIVNKGDIKSLEKLLF